MLPVYGFHASENNINKILDPDDKFISGLSVVECPTKLFCSPLLHKRKSYTVMYNLGSTVHWDKPCRNPVNMLRV